MTDTPKNLDGMVVDAGEFMSAVLDTEDRHGRDWWLTWLEHHARPERASTSECDARTETTTTTHDAARPPMMPIGGIDAYINEQIGPCTKCGGDVVILMNKSMNAPDFSLCKCPSVRRTQPDAEPQP